MPVKPAAKPPGPFDVHAFLDSAGASRRIVRFARGAVVFAQGSPANSVFYIQEGGVKLSVLSSAGKEAVVAMSVPAISSAKGAWPGSSFAWARPRR